MREMIQVKQWHVSMFDTADLEYVQGLGCRYEVNDSIKTREIIAPNGSRYLFRDLDCNYGLYITTQNKKQESLLMLKYSGNITLLRMFYTHEHQRYDFEPYI
jgi:hypothetical protein